MGYHELCKDFNEYRVEIICENAEEVVEATNLLLKAGVPHGASGYSRRYMSLDSIPSHDVWRNLQGATGGNGIGIEYSLVAGPKSIPLYLVYERYNVPYIETVGVDKVCADEELESFLLGNGGSS